MKQILGDSLGVLDQEIKKKLKKHFPSLLADAGGDEAIDTSTEPGALP